MRPGSWLVTQVRTRCAAELLHDVTRLAGTVGLERVWLLKAKDVDAVGISTAAYFSFGPCSFSLTWLCGWLSDTSLSASAVPTFAGQSFICFGGNRQFKLPYPGIKGQGILLRSSELYLIHSWRHESISRASFCRPGQNNVSVSRHIIHIKHRCFRLNFTQGIKPGVRPWRWFGPSRSKVTISRRVKFKTFIHFRLYFLLMGTSVRDVRFHITATQAYWLPQHVNMDTVRFLLAMFCSAFFAQQLIPNRNYFARIDSLYIQSLNGEWRRRSTWKHPDCKSRHQKPVRRSLSFEAFLDHGNTHMRNKSRKCNLICMLFLTEKDCLTLR